MTDVGRLLGRGRDAEIFDLGGGRVLRRAMDGRSLAAEAAVMAHAHAAGVPVPAVHDVTAAGEIVMDRVDGRTLGEELLVGAVSMDAAMRTLVDLHDAVHAVPAPPDLPRRTLDGDRLLHLDLHVLNVISGDDGPVLIDWAMARAGPPEADLAMTWILHSSVAAAEAGHVEEKEFVHLRRALSKSLLALVDVSAVATVLPEVSAWRCADPSVSAAEADRVRALCATFPAIPT
ncbi:MAG TPA: phosphotransferase [Nocardioidaceae bacterium]|nr:phosphotransferase [Nocardioidaceae bacterium]